MYIRTVTRRLQHGKQDLDRRHSPCGIMQGSFAMHDRIIELIDDFGARNAGRGDRVEPGRSILIDHDAIEDRTQIGALASHKQGAEVLMRTRFAWWTEIGAAVIARILVCSLVALRSESRAGLSAIRRLRLAHLADPAFELV